MTPEIRENQEDSVRSEKESSESEVRYRSLFEKAPVSITLVNLSGIIIDCNKACENLTGYRKEELVGQPFQTLSTLAPHDLPNLINNFEILLKGGEVAPYELEMERKTGERRTIEVINSILMKNFKIVGFQILATDITERKRAEQLSIESERKSREKSFELQLINEIFSYGNTSGDLSSFLQKSLEKILQFGHFLGGGIYLHNEINKHNILATTLSTSQDLITMVQEVDMTKEPYKRALTTQEAFIINDIDQILPELKPWGIQSVLSAPLLAKNRYLGTLNLVLKMNLPADSVELSFYTLIGQQIGSIIQKFQAEQSLRASEAKYRSLFEDAPYAIVLLDSEGNIIESNSSVETVFGYKKEQVIGQNFLNLNVFSPLTASLLKERFAKMVVEDNVKPVEAAITKPNGQTAWVYPSVSLIKLDDKKIFQYILQDITERKEAEQRLKESEEGYRLITENLSEIINVFKYEKIMEYANKESTPKFSWEPPLTLEYINENAYKRVLGYNKEDLIGTNPLNVIHPEDREALIQNLRAAYDTNETTNVVRVRKKDKTYLWMEIKSKLFKDGIGQLKFLNISRDISAQKVLDEERNISEQKLKASEEKYRLITENLNEVIGVFSFEGNLEYMNEDTTNKILGYTKEDLLGTKPFDLMHPDDRDALKKTYRAAFEKKDAHMEVRVKRKDGIYIWMEMKAKTFKDGAGQIKFLNISRDISEQKRMELELKESEEKYRTLFEQSPDLIILDDSKGTVIDVNSTVEKVFGYQKKDLVGKNFLDLGIFSLESISMVKQYFQKRLKGEPISYYELPTVKSNGEIVWLYPQGISITLRNEPHVLYILQNITERKLAQQLLEESEERYRTLFEESPFIIALINNQGSIIDINSTIEKILGYKKKDLIRRKFLDLGIISPEVLPRLKQNFSKRVKGELVEPLELQIIKANGDKAWIYPKMSILKLEHENIFLYIIQDITERKVAEQRLKESEERYRSLFEESPFIITLVNKQGKIVDINSTVEKLFGYKKKDVVGHNFTDLGIFSPEALQDLKQNFQRRGKGEPALQNEIPLLKANGDTAWIHPQMAILKLEQEDMLLYTIQDITERKVAEQRLKESEERYRLITENSNDFIMVNDAKPTVDYVNEATYHRFLGYTNKDLQGTNPLDLIHPEDQEILLKAYPAAIKTEGTTSEIRVKRKDGTYLWVEMKAKSFVAGAGQTKFLSISRDISERKALEETRKRYMQTLEHEVEQKTQALRNETEELQKALESLEIAQEHLVQSEKLASIGLLAAGVAHEINNPLMGMINYAQIVKDELETRLKVDLNVKPYSFLNGIIKEGERISEIVEGLLSFAREDRGEFIATAVSEIINSALALLLPKIKNSQIEIKLEYDNDIPKIPMKTRNIRQVILNVLQNSIAALNEKYSSPSTKGDKVITIKTSKLILDEKPCVKISIKDNGTGIRNEDLPKVFDPFFSTKTGKGTKGDGTGLGLSISYGIIKDHNGRIEIQSEWGSWTLLSIILPLEL